MAGRSRLSPPRGAGDRPRGLGSGQGGRTAGCAGSEQPASATADPEGRRRCWPRGELALQAEGRASVGRCEAAPSIAPLSLVADCDRQAWLETLADDRNAVFLPEVGGDRQKWPAGRVSRLRAGRVIVPEALAPAKAGERRAALGASSLPPRQPIQRGDGGVGRAGSWLCRPRGEQARGAGPLSLGSRRAKQPSPCRRRGDGASKQARAAGSAPSIALQGRERGDGGRSLARWLRGELARRESSIAGRDCPGRPARQIRSLETCLRSKRCLSARIFSKSATFIGVFRVSWANSMSSPTFQYASL